MNKQFTFDTESAVIILNHLASEIDAYKKHGEALFSDTLKHRNNGRIEAYQAMHDFLTEYFKVHGLEILELEAENVEEETQVHSVNPAIKGINEIFAHAFSHFSK